MDRLEKAKLHKAIDQVLEDHVSMLKPTRVMIRELILDAIEGTGFGVIGVPAHDETVLRAMMCRSRPHPLDYGKPVRQYKMNSGWYDEGTGPWPNIRENDGSMVTNTLKWRDAP